MIYNIPQCIGDADEMSHEWEARRGCQLTELRLLDESLSSTYHAEEKKSATVDHAVASDTL